MRSVGSHSTSRREKEGNKERTGLGMGVRLIIGPQGIQNNDKS